MKKEDILDNLEQIGLKRKEGEVFLELLKNPNSNGSQLAKSLGYPRTTVYQNLDSLEKQGYIKSYLDKEITYYETIDLKQFLNEQKKRVNKATKTLKTALEEINSTTPQKQFYNLNSLENIIKTVRQILSKAEKRIFINTNIDLFIFKKEFMQLKKKGVKISLFSFNKTNDKGLMSNSYLQNLTDSLGIEVYARDSFDIDFTSNDQRIMIVVDGKDAIIASNYEGDTFSGVYSENRLLASIVREHIVNDINLTRLGKKYGQDAVQEATLDLKELCLE